ncbi:tyrosine-type recombinase/integrase [Methanohalophilus halophilus]|uniref:Integrase n=1 Tax=Methanohalophilus halophilus TaxID=2177 RepID=A0A1L3Q007_9EURY|nr:tyrosine-type recombinase/integrase [Methanohalophilus halophilus]APH38214.1 integrase [Methanohalophilus halophilus]RNI10919.1 integrase [Methanohalophilus halophilus]SDV99613.1 Site-specific recombinase XerD [Methanohalophilus halophilus]
MKYPPEFTGTNADTLQDYKRHLDLNNFKPATINTKLWKVYAFLKFHNNMDVKKVTKREVEDYILHRRKNNKPKTVHNDIIDLRLFFKWLKPENNFFEDIRKVREKRRLPTNDPITPADVRKLLRACQSQRDRAITALTYDSGARISEVLGLNVGDVVFDQYGAVVTVDGKTGMRRIRLVDSVPEIQLWINQHPYKDDSKSPLFTTSRKKNEKFQRLNVRTVQNLFKKLAEEAGINKGVHPHALRHGRLTELVKLGMKEMELRIFAGWEPGSDMPATYLHLSGEDVDKRVLSIHGIVPDEDKPEKDETLKPRECPRCGKKNPADAKYCSQCSLVLDAKTAMNLKEDRTQASNAFKNALNNPEFVAKVAQMMQKEQER